LDKEVIPMRKRIYQAIGVKAVEVERLVVSLSERVAFGCDAAKDRWLGAFMNDDGEVALTVWWDLVNDWEALLELLTAIRSAGVSVEAVAEPTGTYADALVWQLEQAGFPVFRVSPKHSRDYAEIYDGVPSGHDAKSAAVVADLHRIKKSRLWKRPSRDRRVLRAAAKAMDWLKADQLRYHNRLEAELALHWPELGRILALSSATAIALIETFGGPTGVACRPSQARSLMRKVSRGLLGEDKIESVVASASSTVGCPMLKDEVRHLKRLGAKLSRLRDKLRAAEKRLTVAAEGDEVVKRLGEEVGDNTAAVLTARLGHLTDYDSAGALLRAAGISLKERSSGKHKGKLKITKRGSSTARRWLFLAVLRWIQKDPIAKAWYLRKVARNGGNKMKALVALMRKLLAGLFHVARGQAFDSSKLFDVRRLELAA
jgi:transposase